MADDSEDHDELITEFCRITGAAPHVAHHYLGVSQWDLDGAAENYYSSIEGARGTGNDAGNRGAADEDAQPTSNAIGRGGRTLGGGSIPQPIPTTSSVPPPPATKAQPPKKKFATLGDLGGGAPGHAGHGHDDDDDDETDEEDQDLFAGGEKSGLAVQNPDDLKRKILEKARKNGARPGGDNPQAPQTRFTGTARTLGGDDTPSRVIEDPSASAAKRAVKVERRLHFWADGFSVDDGPLYRSDDPQNAEILNMIKQGRAPIQIMNVQPNQEVDVKVEQHQEKYVQPKKKYKPFEGGGQRLGSPTPGLSSPTPGPVIGVINEAVSGNCATGSSEPAPAGVAVNDSEPTISLQIRLGDGTRLVSRFNITHTIGDVYTFVNASSSASQHRPWVLMTTFPSKELSDESQVLGDFSEFKRGGVVVQKWR